jgi:hypothetical protein
VLGNNACAVQRIQRTGDDDDDCLFGQLVCGFNRTRERREEYKTRDVHGVVNENRCFQGAGY